MIQRVLIQEKDKEITRRLVRALENAGVSSVIPVTSMRETLMAIDRDPAIDLAFIPLEKAGHQARPLRALRPEIALVPIARAADACLPEDSRQPFQGLLHGPHLEVEFSELWVRLQSTRAAPADAVASTIIPANGGQPPIASAGSKRLLSRGPDWQAITGFVAFILPKLVFYMVVLLAIIFLTYLGLDMATGTDFVPAVKEAVPSTIEYVQRLLQGDLGTTTTASGTARPLPVTEVLQIWLPRTLGLLAISLLFAAITGLILGVQAAIRGSKQSLGIIVTTIIGVSVPSFFAAFLLQWALTSFTRFSGRSLIPVGGFGWDSHLILPVLVLAARPLAQITRITFVSTGEVLHQDYVRTARSKGLRNVQVMGGHVMRNAAIPILTTIGISLRFMLTSLPVVEFYFGWLGAGYLLLKGISQQDEDLTIALVLCLGMMFIIVNFLLEISYLFVDPRLRDRQATIATMEKKGLRTTLRAALVDLDDLLRDNAVVNWFQRRRQEPAASPFRRAMQHSGWIEQDQEALATVQGRHMRWRRLLANYPLVIGTILVTLLVIVVFFGPNLTPTSPYQTQGLVKIDGKLTPPPFAPGETHPWGTDSLGRDIMSLIIAGAQQTLILAVMAVTARMAVGILTGALAGWTAGSRLDQLITRSAEVIYAFPTLLLTMIVILAIGIRQGMMPFVIALCFVGWGETMQYVRSEVMKIRPKPFIESAIAIGARTPRIIGRHIMPILFSSLISIAALEMGAVLMLLGELGFIKIFIGGGSLIELPNQTIIYSDVPEWGALLSNIRYEARAYPWTALYPMLAFFIAVLSFNLFGEGIRRAVAQGHLIVNRVINRYTLTFAVVVVVGAGWLRSNSGAYPYYKASASAFDSQKALENVVALSDPVLEGRALGTAGMDQTAEAIAERFAALGLQAGGEMNTFYQERKHGFQKLDSEPVLVIHDGGPAPEYSRDFAVYPSATLSQGQASAPVRLIGLGKLSAFSGAVWRPIYPELERKKVGDDILMVLSDREADVLDYKGKAGLLVVTDDPALIARRHTLGSNNWDGQEPDPQIWITEETANRLMAGSGYTVKDIQDQIDRLAPEELLDLPLETRVTMQIEGTLEEKWPIRNVIGYLPGTSGKERCQICLGHRLIVVMAQYDSPPAGLDGEVFPAANDNASGVGVMLEAIRIIQETEYQPYKTFLFVAYSGEGLDGGAFISDAEVQRFLQAKTGFSEFELEAIVRLRGVGGGSGKRLEVSAGGSLRLAELFEKAARQMGAPISRGEEVIDIGQVYEDGESFGQGGQEAPLVRLSWQGWDEHSRLSSDTIKNLHIENLNDAGRTLSMALMILGREQNY